MFHSDAIAAGGTSVPSDTTQAVVSAWHIPYGAHYDQAYVVRVFFDDVETAKRIESRWESMPEMAFCIPYADWLTIQQKRTQAEETDHV